MTMDDDTTTHTPGPWRAILLRGIWDVDAGGTCNSERYSVLDDLTDVDAYLIAAAPALLLALEEALDLFADQFCYGDGRVIVDHATGEPYGAGGAWVVLARAAVAAAKGGAQ